MPRGALLVSRIAENGIKHYKMRDLGYLKQLIQEVMVFLTKFLSTVPKWTPLARGAWRMAHGWSPTLLKMVSLFINRDIWVS
jgi:hypothetical protein